MSTLQKGKKSVTAAELAEFSIRRGDPPGSYGRKWMATCPQCGWEPEYQSTTQLESWWQMYWHVEKECTAKRF